MMLQENIDPENLPSVPIPRDWATMTPPNPFIEILANVNVGDSITLKVPVDSLPPNPQLMGKKFLNYKISIKDIKDSIAFSKEIEKKEAARKMKIEAQSAKIPSIQELLKTSIAGYKSGAIKPTTTASGLKYIIHEQGKGAVAKNGETVKVEYFGVLTDNTEFDNSFKRGEPISVPLGQQSVIPGWEEALTTLPRGTKATVFIPSKLGYGATGSGPIPANSELVFYMEIQ
jgi:FKBP-type peptidyl-prolyl cis-trans isomerase